MRKSVYLDTTVPSYLFDERKSLEYPCSITKKWWAEERCKFFIFISLETLAELNRGNYPHKDEILDFAHNIKQLNPIEDIRNIALY